MADGGDDAGSGTQTGHSDRPRAVRSYAEVSKETGSQILEQVVEQRARLRERLRSVACVVAVVSGKGGVGKSAVAANLARTLARRGARVGALDADLNGPCLGRMLGILGHELGERPDGIVPATDRAGVKAISTELLLEDGVPLRWKGPDSDRFVWEGATEAAALREFLSDVIWGDLDYLVVDVPPGTDKIGRLLDLVPEPGQVLLVTIPSKAAASVVARAATQLLRAGVGPVGLVRNMTAYEAAEEAGGSLPLFSDDGADPLQAECGLEVWAEIPFDPTFSASTDDGRSPGDAHPGPVGAAFEALADRIEAGPQGRQAAQ